jgi:hypothetical protein
MQELSLTPEMCKQLREGKRVRISVAQYDDKMLDVVVQRIERSTREAQDSQGWPEYEVSSEWSVYSTASDDTPRVTMTRFPLLALPDVMAKY